MHMPILSTPCVHTSTITNPRDAALATRNTVKTASCHPIDSLNDAAKHFQFVSLRNSSHNTQRLFDFASLHCSFPRPTACTVLTEHPNVSLQNSAFRTLQVLYLPFQD